MIEVVKLTKKGKTPLMLEVDVPPLCKPLLVGNPNKDSSLLRWVESPSKRGTVLTWGQDCSVETILVSMIEMSIERSSKEGWGIEQESLEKAISRMKSLGVDQVDHKDGLVFPSDPSMLGSIVVVGDRVFPVIHNVRRGFCLLKGERSDSNN